MATSHSGGKNLSTRREPPTMGTLQKQSLVSLLDKVKFFSPIFDKLAGNGVRFQMLLKIDMNLYTILHMYLGLNFG
jgi:hypothetical protein